MTGLTVGLTGGIASGKTLVEAAFRALDVPVLDADQVSRQVVAPGQPGLSAVVELFGRHVLQADGSLDRRQLREVVFADPAARSQLESVLHPLIGASMRQWRDQQTAAYAVLSIAILLESRFRSMVDFVLVVDVPESVQRERLVARDHISAELAAQMMAAQMAREQRRDTADGILDNSGSIAATQAAVAQWHAHFLRLSQTPDSAIRLN